jgi:hypothetical protein
MFFMRTIIRDLFPASGADPDRRPCRRGLLLLNKQEFTADRA